jgi:hypothetical protein
VRDYFSPVLSVIENEVERFGVLNFFSVNVLDKASRAPNEHVAFFYRISV